MTIPTFLDIQSDEFKLIAEHVKKLDKEFFFVVDSSKYTQVRKNGGKSRTEMTML